MKIKNNLILLLTFVLCCVLLVIGCGENVSKKKPEELNFVTIIDSAGNKVEVPCPANRIITLTTDNTEAMIALGAADKLVGVSDGSGKYYGIEDKLENIAQVGNFKEPNLEKIAELKPDVVLGYESSIEIGIKDKLQEMGIPFVVCECGEFDNFQHDIELIGKILGKEDEAKDLLSFHHSIVDMITDRTKDIRFDQRPRVYLVLGFSQGGRPYTTYGKDSDIGYYLDAVKAENIASELSTQYPKVSPEWLLTQDNIEMIIDCCGSATVDSTPEPLIAIKEETYLHNPVFANIKAVREGRVHVIGRKVYKGIRFPIGLLYFAKWCHPDLFEDIDPESYHSDYLQKFLGVKLKNVWAH